MNKYQMNKKLQLVLISILLLAITAFFCCCGIDTSTVAGSASQVYQQEENDDLDDIDVYENDESDGEDSDFDDYDNSLELDDIDSEELDEDEDAEDEEGSVITYVLNTNTKKFHYPDCYSVDQMKDKNKLIEETTREDLIERGYDPCGNCNP